jgi:hypothetical protein
MRLTRAGSGSCMRRQFARVCVWRVQFMLPSSEAACEPVVQCGAAAGVISLTALGLGITNEAANEAAGAAARASQLLDALFPALLAAFR